MGSVLGVRVLLGNKVTFVGFNSKNIIKIDILIQDLDWGSLPGLRCLARNLLEPLFQFQYYSSSCSRYNCGLLLLIKHHYVSLVPWGLSPVVLSDLWWCPKVGSNEVQLLCYCSFQVSVLFTNFLHLHLQNGLFTFGLRHFKGIQCRPSNIEPVSA